MQLRARLGPNGQVRLSYEQRQELGGGVRIPLTGTVNGTPFRTTSFRLGDFTGIALSKDVQRAAGVSPGEEVDLEISRDTSPRTVELPPALAAALAGDPVARAAYDALPPPHRREYAEWVAGAATEEVRERRVAKTLELLRPRRPAE